MASRKKDTHYTALGVSECATTKQIREAFISLSKSCHPDSNPTDPKLHAKFVRINEAYIVLSNVHTRDQYNLKLSHQSTSVNDSKGYQDNNPYDPFIFRHKSWDTGDKTKNRNGSEDNYYGIKGIKRVPNKNIAAGAVAFMFAGMLLQFIGAKIAINRGKETSGVRVMCKLLEARELAKENGGAHQEFLANSSDDSFQILQAEDYNSPIVHNDDPEVLKL